MAMTKFNVLLDPKQVDALRAIQEATGAPLSVQIRRAIANWIAARGGVPADPVVDAMGRGERTEEASRTILTKHSRAKAERQRAVTRKRP